MMNLVSLKLWLFLNKLGVDRAIFFTILARGWGAGAGLLTIFFLAKFISPEEQGYYYTFNSIIAIQVFAELGLNYAIIQFASHEMALLTWSTDGRLLGDPKSKRRLQSLVHFALIWFSVAGLLLIAILLPLGLYFFGVISSQNSSDMAIAAPWIFVVVFASINLMITAAIAVLEGCGKVEEMAILRLTQAILSSVLVWTVLSLGGHLYALAANSLIVTLLGIVWLWGKYKTFFKDLLVHRSELTGMNWRNEIWPFQWRIAISWMSGYFSFQIFNPLLFAAYGPVVAGRMGMSLQIVGAMNGLAITWITTKAPTYGKLIAQKELEKLDSLFNRGLKQSFLMLLFGVNLGLMFLWYLETSVPRYAERILPFNLMICLCIAALANHVSGAQGAYLRAYKKDPLMPLSVISGVAISILSAISIPRYGADGAVISYLFVVLVIGLIFGTVIFVKKNMNIAMNKEIFLTIGIPTFLREKSLIELLMDISVFIPHKNCEVLIINNGPPLDISICIENLIKSGYVVTVINNKKNCGGQENVIRIYENALGEYVWFLGDDDRLYPDSILHIIEALITNPCDCLLFDSDAVDHPELNLRQGYHNSNAIFCGSIPLRKLMFAPLAIIRSDSITQALPYARLSLGCFAPQLLLILLSNIESFFYLKRKTIMCEMANISIDQRLSILPVFLGIGYLKNINIEKSTKKMLKKLIHSEWRYYLRPRGVIVSLIVAKLQGSSESILKFSQAGFRNYPLWLALVFPILLIMVAILPKVIIKFIYDFAAKVLKKKTGYLNYYSSGRI